MNGPTSLFCRSHSHLLNLHSSSIRVSSRDMASPPSAEGCVHALRLVGNLKRVERTGWINHGVADPESVADHMHRMAVMCLLATCEADNPVGAGGINIQRHVICYVGLGVLGRESRVPRCVSGGAGRCKSR